MAIIINFQEYVKRSGRSNQRRESKGISSEVGRIIYFNKKEALEQ